MRNAYKCDMHVKTVVPVMHDAHSKHCAIQSKTTPCSIGSHMASAITPHQVIKYPHCIRNTNNGGNYIEKRCDGVVDEYTIESF